MAIDRICWLSINRIAIGRKDWQSIEKKGYQQNSKAIDTTLNIS